MKRSEPKQISVFIASPGDLAPERKVFKDTIDSLNTGFADGAKVKFVPAGWEDLLAETGRRTQAVINREIEECDIFILALHRRWGQEAPDSTFTSYTEEEFNLAFKLWRKKKSPEVLVFFKNVDNASLSDPGVELEKILGFRKKLEDGHAIIIRSFNTEVDFGQEVDRHLRAFARGEWADLDKYAPGIKFPQVQVNALTKAERAVERRVERAQKQKPPSKARAKSGEKGAAVAKADLSLVKIQQTDLVLARAAVQAARDGRIEDARVLFAKATKGTTDLSILSVAAEFFRRIGDPDNASRLVQRQVAIARDRQIAAQHYFALVPQDLRRAIQEQVMAAMLAQLPEEVADELRSIYEEAFGSGKMERMSIELLVKHYTESEIVGLARFLASPVGQSSIQKQQTILAETMSWAQTEFLRVLLQRHPELTDSIAQLPVVHTIASPAALPPPAELDLHTAGPAASAGKRGKSNRGSSASKR